MVNTHYKSLAARHGRGTAGARHGHGMLCVNRPLMCYLSQLDLPSHDRRVSFRQGCADPSARNAPTLRTQKTFRCTSGLYGKIICCITHYFWSVASAKFVQANLQTVSGDGLQDLNTRANWVAQARRCGPSRFTGEGEPSLWAEPGSGNRQSIENGLLGAPIQFIF
jgi:hypothetical protein